MLQLIWIIQTKVNDLDVVKLKFVPKDLKKIGDIVDKEVVKKTVYNTLNAKVNNLEKKKVLMHLLWFKQINTTQINKIWRCWE